MREEEKEKEERERNKDRVSRGFRKCYKNEKISSIKSILGQHDGTQNLSFVVYDDEEKIMVELDSEKQKVNISPKLLSELEGKNIFYKLN